MEGWRGDGEGKRRGEEAWRVWRGRRGGGGEKRGGDMEGWRGRGREGEKRGRDMEGRGRGGGENRGGNIKSEVQTW